MDLTLSAMSLSQPDSGKSSYGAPWGRLSVCIREEEEE